MKVADSALRRNLGRIGLGTADDHAGAIAKLNANGYPHSIQPLDPQPSPARTTCLAAALGLADRSEYVNVAEIGMYAGRRFTGWLLQNGHLKHLVNPADGCLVLYFEQEVWTHAGTIDETGQVVSKWGSFNSFRHQIDHVPNWYGDGVRFFDRPGRDEALQLFLRYRDDCLMLPLWAQPS